MSLTLLRVSTTSSCHWGRLEHLREPSGSRIGPGILGGSCFCCWGLEVWQEGMIVAVKKSGGEWILNIMVLDASRKRHRAGTPHTRKWQVCSVWGCHMHTDQSSVREIRTLGDTCLYRAHARFAKCGMCYGAQWRDDLRNGSQIISMKSRNFHTMGIQTTLKQPKSPNQI